MDFTNLASIEFVRAIEAQREHDRSQKKWLMAWRDLEREARTASPPERLPARPGKTISRKVA